MSLKLLNFVSVTLDYHSTLSVMTKSERYRF